MLLKERYQKILEHFAGTQPMVQTELAYNNPFELLVAVILSAQCTDKRVNLTTPALFKAFPDAQSMAAAGAEQIFPLIKSISYPNNKAKHLEGMAKMLVEQFQGQVPDTVEDLVKLPGVGRKTANVIVSVVFKQPAMAVDTHVFRVSARIGLTKKAKTPLEAEKQLMKNIPPRYVADAHHWLILHGRYVCVARKPKCTHCQLTKWCRYFAEKQKKASKQILHGSV